MTEEVQRIFKDLLDARRARNAALVALRNSRGGLIPPEAHAYERADDVWHKTVAKLDTWIASQGKL